MPETNSRTYVMTAFAPEDSTEGDYQTTFDAPSNLPELDLLGVALEQVGIFDPDMFTITSDDNLGYVINDPEGECVAALCPEETTAGFDDGDDLFVSYSEYEGDF